MMRLLSIGYYLRLRYTEIVAVFVLQVRNILNFTLSRSLLVPLV